MTKQAKVNSVVYEKIVNCASFNSPEGIYVWRVFYAPNWRGVVKEHKENIGFFPALNRDEFKSAHKAADELIRHYQYVTGDMLKKCK